MIPDAKTSSEYVVNVDVTKGSIFGATLFYYRLMTFLMLSVIFLLLSITISVIRLLISSNH